MFTAAELDWLKRRNEFRDRLLAEWVECGLKIRAANCLANAEIEGVAQLTARTRDQLMALPGLGRRSMMEVDFLLHRLGYSFVGRGRPALHSDIKAAERLRALGWRVIPPQ